MTTSGASAAPVPGKRVLVVEDELMIRMLLEDMLSEIGYTVAAEATQVDEALAVLDTAEFNVAILDVNVNGHSIGPVAQALADRGRPFVFSTGYGEQGLPDGFGDRPMLRKPFQMDGLRRTLASALGDESA